MTHNWFKCSIRYEKTMENGMNKKVLEPYLVDAMSFTEAEARIIEEMTPYISGEMMVADISRYNLSVSSYIERETEIEETDPIELMNQIHRLFFENLRLKLQIERITSDMHGHNMEPLLISIEKLARTMRNELKRDKDERLPAERQLKMFEA